MTGSLVTVRIVIAALALLTARAAAAPQSAASVPDVLARVGSYLADYQDRVTSVVLEEDYTQSRRSSMTIATGGTAVATESRRLRSDVVMTVEAGPRWVTFRDVFEVDGRPVRDRDDRLAKLFLAPPSNQTLDQAGRILAEGARFNVYPRLNRTLNVPFTTLVFLLPAHQARSDFAVDGTDTIDGQPTVVLRFSERGMPRILRSDDSAPARGTFWVQPASGRVLRSELVFTTVGQGIGRVTATIRVTFAPEPRTGLWLPAMMDERYSFASGDIIAGTARYSKARQFAVDTNSSVKPAAP